MINRVPLSRFEFSAYLFLITGVIGDHLTTGIALTHENIYESNQVALNLMQNGLWVPLDAILILISILIPYILIRVLKQDVAQYLLIPPLFAGLIRLIVTFWNLSIMI
jgi:hypothetical protein